MWPGSEALPSYPDNTYVLLDPGWESCEPGSALSSALLPLFRSALCCVARLPSVIHFSAPRLWVMSLVTRLSVHVNNIFLVLLDLRDSE